MPDPYSKYYFSFQIVCQKLWFLTNLSKGTELVSSFSFQESCWFIEASFPNSEWFAGRENCDEFFAFGFCLFVLALFCYKSFSGFLLLLG